MLMNVISIEFHFFDVIVLIKLQSVYTVIDSVGTAWRDTRVKKVVGRLKRVSWFAWAHVLLQLENFILDLFLDEVSVGFSGFDRCKFLFVWHRGLCLGFFLRLLVLLVLLHLLLHKRRWGTISSWVLGNLRLWSILVLWSDVLLQSGDLLFLSLNLLHHLDNDWVILILWLDLINSNFLKELSFACFFNGIFALRESHLRHVNTLCVVHGVSVQKVFHNMGGKDSLLILVDFANIGVLPLKANLLLSPAICVLLDSLEDSRSQLCFQVAESSLFFQRLDNYSFEIVHLFDLYIIQIILSIWIL